MEKEEVEEEKKMKEEKKKNEKKRRGRLCLYILEWTYVNKTSEKHPTNN
jgi:hypothetical protein